MSKSSNLKNTPWSFWPTMGFSFLIVLGYILVDIVLSVFYTFNTFARDRSVDIDFIISHLASNATLVALVSCISMPVCCGLILGIVKLRKKISVKDYLGIKWVSRKTFLIWLMIFIGYGALWNTITFLLGRDIVPPVMSELYRTSTHLTLLWFALVVAAPITEEFFFRGFMFKGLQHSKLGNIGAIVFTSFVWSIVHLQYNAYEVGSIFLIGLLLGWARVKTGSVLLTIAMHMMVNLIATLETRYYVIS